MLLDIKSFDPVIYSRVTSVSLEPTLQLAKYLDNINKPTWIRFVVVPGLTDPEDNVDDLAQFIAPFKNVERVEVVPFQQMEASKLATLGYEYTLSSTPIPDDALMERVRQRVQVGEITLAGTSAGAAVMGHHMIAGGSSGESPNRALVDMAMGLGIIPEVIVDQHFHNRNRMARLISAIASHPERLGVGIDEDTCAIFEKDGLLRVIGRGTVTIVDVREMTYTNQAEVSASEPLSLHNLRVHVLCHGDRYNLHQHQPISVNSQQ